MSKSNINCGTLFYYTLPSNNPFAVHYVVEMKDPIDGDALRKAVDTAMTRYPYLAKKVVATKEGLYLEDNPLPVVVRKTHHSIKLCSSESNWHQFALTYAGYTIFMCNTHSLFDGRGRSALLHTIMYYYCKFRYNEDVQMDGVNLVDTPIDPAEYYDPYDFPIPEPKVQLPAPAAPVPALQLSEMGLVHPSHTQLHHISIDEKQLMGKCKTNDASPNSAIAILLAMAIQRLHPDSEKPIVACIGCDPRAALHADKSHMDLATSMFVPYDKKMLDMDFSEQNTIFRSIINLNADESNLLAGAKGTKQLCDHINSLPTLKEKTEFSTAALAGSFGCVTYSVSYSGKSNFGSCDSHIAAIYPQLSTKGAGLAVEIAATNGKFYLTLIQDWKEDVYFNAFLKELTAQGIDYDLLYSAQLEPIATGLTVE